MKKRLLLGVGIAFVVLSVSGVAIEKALTKENPANDTAQVTISDPITPDILFTKINNVRTGSGIAPLRYTTQLNTSASQKCTDMVANSYYDHVNPSTGKHGYSYVYENIKPATKASENLNQVYIETAEEVVNSWMKSPAHKAAILDPSYTDVGYAVCNVSINGDKSTVVVQHLAEIKQLQAQSPAPQTPQRAPSQAPKIITPPSLLPDSTGIRCSEDYVHPGSVVCKNIY